MIFTKDNPVGIDFMINKMQNKLDSLTWTDPYIYGRVYLNTDRNGKILAEAHVGGNKKYEKDIFVDKKKSAVIGFVPRGQVDFDITGKIQTATVDVVCSINLDKIYSTSNRNDEEALQTILLIIQKSSGWLPIGIRKENVKDVFNFMDTENITFRDMQPFANFAISCKVNYKNNC